MRNQFRKIVIRELKILSLLLVIAALFVVQYPLTMEKLSKKEIPYNEHLSFEQNLSTMGLTTFEIDAVLMMEEFKKQYPQVSGLGYKDTVSLFLAENPNFL